MRSHPGRAWAVAVAVCLASGGCGPGPTTDPAVGIEGRALTPSPPFDGDPASHAVFGVDVSHHEGIVAEAEVECFWASGVRHLIAGTQVPEVTRQQLEMAVHHGLTVDAYVYLLWDGEVAEQVREAFRVAQGFPIARMWLDVEEDPRGLDAVELVDQIREGLRACAAEGSAPCGIYTGPGFWGTYMNQTTAFAAQPLWYAWYNGKKALSAWSEEAFGGWSEPTGKQWAEEPLCNVGVDKDVIKVPGQPTVVVDRALPPDDGQPPPAPTRLYPADGSRVGVGYAKLMTALIPRALEYQLALEAWSRGAYRAYTTWSSPDAFRKTYPVIKETPYRFRARARNAHGWGPWSDWSHFYYGHDQTAAIPGAGASTETTPVPPAPASIANPAPAADPGEPAPAADAPGGLQPDGVTVTDSSVILRCAAAANATAYEFAVEHRAASGAFEAYAKYTATAPSKTFYPQIHGAAYRWRVRARVDGVFGGWSSWASFSFE